MVIRMRMLAALGAVAIASAGCATATGGRLGELHRVADTCPKGKKVAVYVAIDASGAQRGPQLLEARVNAVRNIATKVAACGGHLRVLMFSASTAATITIFESTLEPKGATENARLRRVDGLVADVVEKVEAKLPEALSRLSSQGSDPVGQLEGAHEYAVQVGQDFVLDVLIESSGISRRVHPWELDDTLATKLAEEVSVPDLTGATVTLAGIGRVGDGAPPSTDLVNALRTFYIRVCERTGATGCLATTDITPIGG